MRYSLLCILLLSVSLSFAQRVAQIDLTQPDDNFENILVRNLDHDSLSSTFLIWVKDSVAEHHHNHHTETVYILDGEGIMSMNGRSFGIKQGTYVFIPAGTRHSVKTKSKTPLKVLSVQSPFFDGSDRILSEK